MDRYFCVSTRRIKPDTREQFERSWRSAVVEERPSFYGVDAGRRQAWGG